VLSTFAFNYPMVLLFYQNLMTINSLYIAQRMGIVTYEPLDSTRVVRWLPVDMFFVAMLLTSFYSIQILSVPMVTIFKCANIAVIVYGDALFFANYPSRGTQGALFLLIFAAVMAGLNDLEYDFRGYMWTLANCAFTTAFVLYTQSAIANINLSTFGKVYYNNIIALPLVLGADVLVFGDFARLAREDPQVLAKFATYAFAGLFFLSGILGFLQSLTSLRAQQLTSPTTYSMTGSLSKIPLTILGVLVFHHPMTSKMAMYTTLSIGAGVLYSWTKANEELAKRALQTKALMEKGKEMAMGASTAGMAAVPGGSHKSTAA
jgi:GDP-mannose transporter